MALFCWLGHSIGFDVAGLQGQTVVVEGSTNLTDSTGLVTNGIGTNAFFFRDVNSASLPARFYRVRLP